MDSMVDFSLRTKEYSIPVEATISLVGKSLEMPRTTLGGFTPWTPGVGQMKFGSCTMILRQKASRGMDMCNVLDSYIGILLIMG